MEAESQALGWSVVVASFSGEAALRDCLTSLATQGADEVIVATNEHTDVVARLKVAFPTVRFLTHPGVDCVFRLRSLGVVAAGGRWVALIEDHCTVAPGWLSALQAGHSVPGRVVGGPIENGRVNRRADWALYLCEYSEYMSPRAEGTAAALLGTNVSYLREDLLSCEPIWRDKLHDNEVNDQLRATGRSLHMAADATVFSHLRMTLWEGMAHLYGGGRRFGGYRKSRSSPARRVFWVLASPLVPLVWFARIARRVATRRPARLGTLILGLPYIACLLLAWAAGEAVSYLKPAPQLLEPTLGST